jgi:outer membrane receptor protein involved in Fe transport
MSSARCAGLRALLVVIPCLLHCSVAISQETTGAVFGVVRSQDGAPLPGVTITIVNSSNGLHRLVVVDADGEYRFLTLPPATYDLEAAMDGFRGHRQSLAVALGQAIRNNIEMELGAFTDTIEVTAAQAPPIDVTSTVVGMTVNISEMTARVPVEREATQVALLAAGTLPGDEAFDGRTPGQRLASVGGASVAENTYIVNGLNISNFREMLGSSRVPFAFLEEVQVKTGGWEAEFGRSTGGVVNMVTRSGSNTLHGAASLYYQPEGLQSQEPNTVFTPNQRERRESLEGNLSLGGPIIRDKLHFFVFATYEDAERFDFWLGPANTVLADSLEISQPYWGGKIDWNLSTGHRIEGTFLSDRVDVDKIRWQYDPDDQDLGEALGAGVDERGGDSFILGYSGLLGERVVLSLQAGRNEFARTDRSDGDECPVAADLRTGRPVVIGCFVNTSRGVSNDTRQAYRADLDYVVGAHSLRAGVDYEQNTSEDDTSYSGGVLYVYWLNGTRFPGLPPETELVHVRHRRLGGSFDVFSSAAYFQDSWTVSPRLNLNAGLRWESYDNRNGLGETFIETDDQFAPRIGAVWDPAGDGRSKLHASFGVYHLPIASNTNVKVAGAFYQTSTWYVLEGGINPDGSPESLGEELSNDVISDGETPDPREIISDNFEPMSQNEFVLGYERILGETWSVGVRGVARSFNQVIEDYSIHHALEAVYGIETDDWVYRIGNPGSAFDGWYDIDGDGVLDRVHLSADDLGYPEAERTYYSLGLTFHRRFANNWMLQGSYTWSRVHGNYEGYTNSDVGQSDPGVTQTFDFPGLLEHGRGDLPNDHRHIAKAFGAYSWPWGLQLGGNFFYSTGRPINSFGLHPTDEDSRAYGAVSFYTNGEPRPRGCCGRTDNVWGLDLMARYNFRLGNVEMNLRLDVFNVFDNDAVTRLDEFGELDNGETNPTYGETINHQNPRRVRFGIGASF